MPTNDIDAVRRALADLTQLHGWAPLQTPRNMTLALTSCVGAVAGHLQFTADGPAIEPVNPDLANQVADCLVYLIRLADGLGVDMVDNAVTRLNSLTAASQPAGAP